MTAAAPTAAQQFRTVLEATGGKVERSGDPRRVAAAIAGIAQAQGVRAILYDPDPVAERMNLKLLLAAHGIDLVSVTAAGDGAPQLQVALTGAQIGIAETGTLVVGGRPGGWGLASVLPWVHIALLPASAIVADLPTAFERFAERLGGGEGDWVWITGPSRTADIGHTLVMGAHGPNALHVVIVE